MLAGGAGKRWFNNESKYLEPAPAEFGFYERPSISATVWNFRPRIEIFSTWLEAIIVTLELIERSDRDLEILKLLQYAFILQIWSSENLEKRPRARPWKEHELRLFNEIQWMQAK